MFILTFRNKTKQLSLIFRRNKGSLGLWNQNLNSEIKLDIEKHWTNEVLYSKREHLEETYYILPMFPYPSGNLHMGHVRVYSISDTLARFHKLNQKCVIHPMGWDAFGLPAENAAIEHNIPPQDWTITNIDSMKKQLLKLGCNFDWNKEICTCYPQYYKWTQYIFLKLYEKGLAYQNKAMVNWDPIDKTVLADEQVDDLGYSWRSGAKVEKKILTQWFIRTTKFAKELYDGLNNENLENWKDIINLQKHWIGECNGITVTFIAKLCNKTKPFDVWTSEPYKFMHGTFLTVKQDNVDLQELLEIDNKNLKALNPITNTEIPIYINNDGNYPEGRDVYIACPLVNDEDMTLARLLNIPTLHENHVKINIESDSQKAIDIAQYKKVGGYYVSSKLKDWLISRQRYWGTPIPIIHCTKCGTVPVPYDELPLKLPDNNYFKLSQTLANLNDWVNCKCPKCFSNAKRETDTMDTFVDSSWYYYRFLDSDNLDLPFRKEKLIGNAPIHLYIGGKEHAVLHLYYARFMSYFLHTLGWTPTKEPFKKLLVQGMVMGQSYKLKSSGKYIPADAVEKVGKDYRQKVTGEPVLVQWEKMSKSKYNGINPDTLLSTYGCDTVRLLILADVPPATSRHWSDATFPGVLNWQHRLWITIREFLKYRSDDILYSSNNLSQDEADKFNSKIWDSRNYFTATTTFHFKYTQKLSVGISRLQSLTNTLRNNVPSEIIAKSKEFELALAALIIMLSPVAPHFCSELWAGFLSAPNRQCKDSPFIDWNKNVWEQSWPKVDDHYKLSFQCKVDGADRCELKIKMSDLRNLTEADAIEIMMKEESVAKRIRKGILKTKYELYPDCRAILHIYTNRKLKDAKIQDSL